MQERIVEGDKFRSPFTEVTFEVKRIHANTAFLQDIKYEDHQVITEIATLVRLYQKVDDESKRGEKTACLFLIISDNKMS